MPQNDSQQIAELEARLENLVKTQIDFQEEIRLIRRELRAMRETESPVQPQVVPATSRLDDPSWVPPAFQKKEHRPKPPETSRIEPPIFAAHADEVKTETESESAGNVFSNYVSSYTESARADLEKFIGENLISKIGIFIVILGVGIFAKFAMDNGWISPLMRVLFGYAMGLGLIAVAIRLKAKYHNFSAVLLSGGMAIMYFITYFAYATYSLVPQPVAFGAMVVFTLFTIASAIVYDRQVIAHIGLVGAYAVPFLLSNDSGNYLGLFTYMTIINGGILAISVVKYWRPIFYTSSFFTWLIFLAWFSAKYSAGEHLYLALIFLAVFAAIFYATKIVHGVVHDEGDNVDSLACIIGTAIIFYGFCLAMSNMETGVWEYAVFFTYLAAASVVILLTSFRFYGRLLVFISYPFTWLIFGSWFVSKYDANEHFALAAVFASVFFAIYYGVTLCYRLLTDDIGLVENAGLVLTNSFAYYGFGYAILDSRENLQSFEGLFTGAHALLHSAVAQIVSRVRPNANDVVQVLAVLIITFTTIAIPVQFDGNYVTLIWTVEAAVLFWFGRARLIRMFEYFSYPLMILATCSLFVDWMVAFSERTTYISEFNRQPLANGDLVTAMVFVATFAFIYVVNKSENRESIMQPELIRPFGMVIGAITLFVLYNSFRIEIGNYYHVAQAALAGRLEDAAFAGSVARFNPDLPRFNAIWQINYTMVFLSILGFVNLRKVRSKPLAFGNIGIGLIGLWIFVTVGMGLLFRLTAGYLTDGSVAGPMNIVIRYISYALAAGLLYVLYEYSRSDFLGELSVRARGIVFEAVLCATVFIVASCELIMLMDQFHIREADKLGLTILWGVYALVLIAIGIAQQKKRLRVTAIVVLAITLVKLFLYDVADLPTIPKTILFVSLGLLMLLVSFLYNKYVDVIFGAQEAKQEG